MYGSLQSIFRFLQPKHVLLFTLLKSRDIQLFHLPTIDQHNYIKEATISLCPDFNPTSITHRVTNIDWLKNDICREGVKLARNMKPIQFDVGHLISQQDWSYAVSCQLRAQMNSKHVFLILD